MARPGSIPTWDINLTNVTTTPAGQLTDGWPVNAIPPSGVENYWKNLVYQWLNWLNGNDLDGNWTIEGDLTVNGTINLTNYKFSTQRIVLIPVSEALYGITSATGPSTTKDSLYGIPKTMNFVSDGTNSVVFPVRLDDGSKIVDYGFRVHKTSNSSVHLYGALVAKSDANVVSNADNGNQVGPGGNPTAFGIDYSANNPGYATMSPSLAVDVATLSSGSVEYNLVIETDGTSNDQVLWAYAAYRRP